MVLDAKTKTKIKLNKQMKMITRNKIEIIFISNSFTSLNYP